MKVDAEVIKVNGNDIYFPHQLLKSYCTAKGSLPLCKTTYLRAMKTMALRHGIKMCYSTYTKDQLLFIVCFFKKEGIFIVYITKIQIIMEENSRPCRATR